MARDQGSIGQAFLTGVPVLDDLLSTGPWHNQDALEVGLKSLVALPIIRDGHLGSVVAWYL